MYKRIVPVILTVVLVLCCSVLPASAAGNEYQILYFEDYVTGYEFEGDDAWAIISLPNELCGVKTNDMHGVQALEPGRFSGTVSAAGIPGNKMNVSAFWPGSYITSSYLSLSNVPEGSRLGFKCSFLLDDRYYQTDVAISLQIGVVYYDKNFNPISSSLCPVQEWTIGDSYIREYVYAWFTVEKPSNAEYICYAANVDLTVERSNDDVVNVYFSFFKPTLKVSSSYFDVIIDGIVNPQMPDGSDTIVDSGNSEGTILEGTEQGRLEAEQLSDASAPFILFYLSGFQMFAYFFSMFSEIGFLKGLLTVSLSLGTVAFLLNSLPSFSSFRSRSGGKE